MSLHYGLLYLDDLQEISYPITGTSTSTGYAPTIDATDDFAHPITGASTSTGYAPTVLPYDIDISGTLSNLKVSNTEVISDSFDLSATFPGLQGELVWGVEIAFDANLPELNGSMDLGLQIDGTLSELQGTMNIAVPFTVDGPLPYLVGSMDMGFIISDKLPNLQGSLDFEPDNNFDFDVSFPGITGSMELLVPFDITGTFPGLTGSMTAETYDYFNISGKLASLDGSLTFKAEDDFTISGKLPVFDGSAEIKIEQTIIIDGDLPPLMIPVFNFSDISTAGLSASFTPDTDGIIRHRRGYDNG